MRLFNVYGRLVNKNVNKYRIKWDGKSRSKIQFHVKQFLKVYWMAQECFEEFPVYGTLLKVDILNLTKKIAIEVNGKQHSGFNKFFHNNSREVYLNSIKRDWKKFEWLQKNDFQIIEIEEDEVEGISKEFIQKKFSIEI